MSNISKMINMSNIKVGQEYRIDFSAEEMAEIGDHLGVDDLASLCVSYNFSKNDLFANTYNLNANVKAKCKSCDNVMRYADRKIDESFEVVLLNSSTTNIDADILQNYDIELISNNQFDITDLCMQYLSLALYM